MHNIRRLVLTAGIFCLALNVWATDIQVLGLTKDKAVLQVDGNTKVLNVGEETDGIKLISADSHQCVLEINGEQQVFKLGSQITSHFSAAVKPTVRLEQDSHGLYRASGMVNDIPVNFIIDTGATLVALNMQEAKKLGIEYTKGRPTQVETAMGKSKAYLVTLREVTLGEIHVYDVPAVVVESDSPPEVLLGMSFLKRLEIRDHDQLLELKQKY